MALVTGETKEAFDREEMSKKGELNNQDKDEEFSTKNDSKYIQHHADKFATSLKEQGFDADVTHSGSKLGASSYVKVYDPQTGRFIIDPIRFSGHSKGVKQNELVHSVFRPSESEHYVKMAQEMRALGPSQHLTISKDQEERIARLRAKNKTRNQTD